MTIVTIVLVSFWLFALHSNHTLSISLQNIRWAQLNCNSNQFCCMFSLKYSYLYWILFKGNGFYLNLEFSLSCKNKKAYACKNIFRFPEQMEISFIKEEVRLSQMSMNPHCIHAHLSFLNTQIMMEKRIYIKWVYTQCLFSKCLATINLCIV